MRPALLHLLLFSLLCSSISSFAQDQLLKDTFVGKLFVIRHFYQESSLHYDSSGNLKQRGKTASWTTSEVLVEKEKLNDKSFELSGQRLVLGYDGEKDNIFLFNFDKIRMEVDLPSGPLTQAVLDELVNRIFVDLKKEPEQVPDYWRDTVTGNVVSEIGKNGKRNFKLKDTPAAPLLTPQDAAIIATNTAQETGIYHVGDKVTRPKIRKQTEPEYSELARRKRYQATCVLQIMIDEQGHPHDFRILKPAGLELDENAVAAVKKWTFYPATLEGKPVKILADVEVSFRFR